MEKLWDLVLQASIYGSIVGIVILIVKTLLKDKISGKWTYLLWMVLIIKLVIPFGPQSSISLFNKIPSNIVNNTIVDSSVIINRSLESKHNDNYEEKNEYISSNTGEKVNKVLPISNNGSIDINKSINNLYGFMNVLPLVWMAGFITTLFISIFMCFTLKKQVKINKNIANENIKFILKKCKNIMNIKVNINLVVNDDIRTPALSGIIKPTILFPNAMLDLKDDEIKYILLHELSHYKRKDILVNYLLVLLQCIHWFNPFIWFFFKKIREDMELATDEMVVSKLNEDEYKNYARTIITIIERISIVPKNIGVLGMADDKKIIKKRIEMIKNSSLFKNKKKLISIIGISCVLILGSTLLTSQNSFTDDRVKGNFENLIQYKNSYVGDNSNTNNLIQSLGFGSFKERIELSTSEELYAVKVYYNLNNINKNKDDIENELFINSVIIFSLIENVDKLDYYILDKPYSDKIKAKYEFTFTRDDIENILELDNIGYYSTDEEKFNVLLQKISKYRKISSNLDEAISSAVKNSIYEDYYIGELDSEAHMILGKKGIENRLYVYTIVNYGSFEFENDVFTLVSGAWGIPMILIFEKDENNNFYFIDYKEVMDGGMYINSIKEMFPIYLIPKVMNSDKYGEKLSEEQKLQAKKYLDSINRNTDINIDYDFNSKYEKEYLDMYLRVEVQNKLFSVVELYDYPTWLGTSEKVIDGIRYVYETSMKTDSDEYEVVVYRKIDESKTVVEEHQYKIYDNDIKEIKHDVK